MESFWLKELEFNFYLTIKGQQDLTIRRELPVRRRNNLLSTFSKCRTIWRIRFERKNPREVVERADSLSIKFTKAGPFHGICKNVLLLIKRSNFWKIICFNAPNLRMKLQLLILESKTSPSCHLPVVNFINILQTAFAQILLCQKNI